MEHVTTSQINNLETSEAAGIWEKCLSLVKPQIPTQSYKTWFEPIRPVKVGTEGELVVNVPSQFFYEWLEEHYAPLIKNTITQLLGGTARLTYIVVPPDESDAPVPVLLKERTVAPPTVQIQEQLPPIRSHMNARYTFANFIKGESNQLARAAATAVANNPGGTSFNPLVIYGGTGLGKTHLVQAIGNSALESGKARRVEYVSSEKFMVEFVESIKSDTMSDFSTYYRSMDILIVDDIQFLAGKEKTQDSFFHTFNTIHQLGKQIVLSSDRAPKDLKGLDDRLLSRFQWGLTADIQPPDLETRTAILRKKCDDDSIDIPQEVLDFMAANVTSNIRELEGCYISLLAKSSLENREINIDLAREVLRIVVNDVRTPITVDAIQKMVAEYYDLPADLLRAKTRRQEVVTARQAAMYLAKEMTNCSLKTIGLHFGGRDHSTVIHAYQSVEDQMKIDSAFRDTLEQLQKKISHSSR